MHACIWSRWGRAPGPCHSQLCAPISGNQICTFPGNSAGMMRVLALPGPRRCRRRPGGGRSILVERSIGRRGELFSRSVARPTMISTRWFLRG